MRSWPSPTYPPNRRQVTLDQGLAFEQEDGEPFIVLSDAPVACANESTVPNGAHVRAEIVDVGSVWRLYLWDCFRSDSVGEVESSCIGVSSFLIEGFEVESTEPGYVATSGEPSIVSDENTADLGFVVKLCELDDP